MEHLMDMAYNMWSSDHSMGKEDFWLRLDYPERIAVFIGNLNYQVENGGFMQWHDNGYSTCGEDIIRILTTVGGCDEVIRLVRHALGEIRKYEEENAYIESDFDELAYNILEEKLSKLDIAFYEVNTVMLTHVETYLEDLTIKSFLQGEIS